MLPHFVFLWYHDAMILLDGKKISDTAHGFLARVIQHEVGHINGELYVDHLCRDCRYGDADKMMAVRKKELNE